MKIKVLEESGIRHGEMFFSHDDAVTVPDNIGRLFVELGWAEDASGAVATGDRDMSPKTIDPARLVVALSGGA